MEINGYVMEGDFSSENAGCSLWGFCRKYEHSFFIKRFTEVTYPISDKISASILEKKRAKCEKYYNRKNSLMGERHFGGGKGSIPFSFLYAQKLQHI